MSIRVATPEDVPEMIEIRLSVRENRLTEAGIAWLTRERVERSITEQGRGWVVEADCELRGFCIALRQTTPERSPSCSSDQQGK